MAASLSANGQGTLVEVGSLCKDTTAGGKGLLDMTRLVQMHAAELVAPPTIVSHEQILANLLEQVQPVDFRALAVRFPVR